MLRNVLFASGALLLISILVGAGVSGMGVRVDSAGVSCPPGYVESVVLEPIQPGEQGSEVIERSCRPSDGEVEAVVLEPLSPEEMERPEYQPTETSPIVRGPSDSTEYRCVVVLKPLEEGGAAVEPVCARGRIESVDGVSLESLYLLAKFYDWTDYRLLLQEFYGPYPCSPEYSYGRPDLRLAGADNRFASGQGSSSCDRVTVYDGYDYTGPAYSWGPKGSTFYALNDEVGSWKIED